MVETAATAARSREVMSVFAARALALVRVIALSGCSHRVATNSAQPAASAPDITPAAPVASAQTPATGASSPALDALRERTIVATNHFARIAQHVGFYDARAVDGRLVIVGCKGVSVLGDDLVHGRDVPALSVPRASCLSVVGVSGSTLVTFAKGSGLAGIDVASAQVRWREQAALASDCGRGTQNARTGAASPYEVLDTTFASTCGAAVLAGETVVTWESGGQLVGRRAATGAVVWRQDAEGPSGRARLLADNRGRVFQPSRALNLVRALDGDSGRALWHATLAEMILRGTCAAMGDVRPREHRLSEWDDLLRPTPDGLLYEHACRLVELDGLDGRERACTPLSCADTAVARPRITRLGPNVVWLGSNENVASDGQSVFATDEAGRLVAYDLVNGTREWAYGILAVGLEFSPQPLFTRPRVEWMGPTEVLVGLGVGPTGKSVLSLFRKGKEPLAPRTRRIEGRLQNIKGWEDATVDVGPYKLRIDPDGRFSGELSGNGSLRLSCNVWTLASHLEPQTLDVDLNEARPLVGVILTIRKSEEIDEGHQTGDGPPPDQAPESAARTRAQPRRADSRPVRAEQ